MMRILFREEAEADLRSIIEHYEEVAPASVSPILADIHRSIAQLLHFPRIGMVADGRSFRRIVTIRYHFKIAYQVNDDQIEILGIFRYQDRRS